MVSGSSTQIDLIEELRLRRWARENYVAPEQRNQTWHPVVLEEMSRKDLEAQARRQAEPSFSTQA
jgi:hypothetical protein